MAISLCNLGRDDVICLAFLNIYDMCILCVGRRRALGGLF